MGVKRRKKGKKEKVKRKKFKVKKTLEEDDKQETNVRRFIFDNQRYGY